ncbi:cysteine proteinase inhibitor 1-like [Primulina eburnea]|uniref:cysteine proteinase inhibitor 1-like n=1 Tax=Primulina eburnea TaxID=1245227 RepID=UPI003C6C748C
MELKSCSLLSAVLLFLVASFHYQVSAVSHSAIVGGWQPIKDLNSPNVLEIAKFAVSVHNKKSNAKLQFVKVVKGESQVVEGMNYKLVITANDVAAGNVPSDYETVVWDKPWAHIRQLTSFVKV